MSSPSSLLLQLPSRIDLVDSDYRGKGIKLYMKRDDLIHPWINGNKWRKLSLQVAHLSPDAPKLVLTYGGAFSNHLVAVAAYCYDQKMTCRGIIRSHTPEKADINNPTIKLLTSMGMTLHYVDPKEYAQKNSGAQVQNILRDNAKTLIIPEGGTSELGAQGAKTIMEEVYQQTDIRFDSVVVSVGTGGTLAGITQSIDPRSRIIAMSPFKAKIEKLEGFQWMKQVGAIDWCNASEGLKFGGIQSAIADYINIFYSSYSILLDPIYTAKGMMYLDKLIDSGKFLSGSNVLFIHTGGLQGIMGYNYMSKNWQNINIPDDYIFLQSPWTTLG